MLQSKDSPIFTMIQYKIILFLYSLILYFLFLLAWKKKAAKLLVLLLTIWNSLYDAAALFRTFKMKNLNKSR